MEELELTDIRKSKKPLYISIALIISLFLGYFIFPGMRGWLDQAWSVLTSGDHDLIQQWVSDFGVFGPVLIVLAMVAQMFLIVIPSWLLMLVAVLAFGPVWGSVVIFCAIFAASTVGYFIGRYFGPAFITRLIGYKSQQNVSEFLEHYGVWAIIVTRINPLLSNDAISFIAGVVRMSYKKFILSTLIGIAPLVVVIAILGQMNDGFKSTFIWISIASLLMFIGFVWWDRKRRNKLKNDQR